MTIRLSASSIKDFLKCSKTFQYRQNPEDSIDTQEAVVGRTVHEMLEKYWNDEVAGRQFAKDKIIECSIDENGMDKIRVCSDVFYNQLVNLRERLTANDLIEYSFNLKLDKEVAISGRIDRILTDEAVVIDWKTGRTKNYISNDVQFIIYYMMYKKIFNSYPSAVLQVNLSTGKVVSFQPNREYINTLFNSVIPQMVERIKRNRLQKEGYFNGSCYNCNFIGACSKDT